MDISLKRQFRIMVQERLHLYRYTLSAARISGPRPRLIPFVYVVPRQGRPVSSTLSSGSAVARSWESNFPGIAALIVAISASLAPGHNVEEGD